MSDQLGLIQPPTDDALKWWQTPLACDDCNRITVRPPLSDKPCAWCRGRLTEVVRA